MHRCPHEQNKDSNSPSSQLQDPEILKGCIWWFFDDSETRSAICDTFPLPIGPIYPRPGGSQSALLLGLDTVFEPHYCLLVAWTCFRISSQDKTLTRIFTLQKSSPINVHWAPKYCQDLYYVPRATIEDTADKVFASVKLKFQELLFIILPPKEPRGYSCLQSELRTKKMLSSDLLLLRCAMEAEQLWTVCWKHRRGWRHVSLSSWAVFLSWRWPWNWVLDLLGYRQKWLKGLWNLIPISMLYVTLKG